MLSLNVVCFGLLVLLPIAYGITCFEPGQCLGSMMLNLGPAENAPDCLHKCQDSVEGCEWFTFYNDSRNCISLTTCLNLTSETCTDCISGEQECPEPVCNVNGRCIGALEGNQLADDVQACFQMCRKIKNCGWFSYDKASKICQVTADCPVLDKTCVDCISSEGSCEAEQIASGAAGNMTKMSSSPATTQAFTTQASTTQPSTTQASTTRMVFGPVCPFMLQLNSKTIGRDMIRNMPYSSDVPLNPNMFYIGKWQENREMTSDDVICVADYPGGYSSGADCTQISLHGWDWTSENFLLEKLVSPGCLIGYVLDETSVDGGYCLVFNGDIVSYYAGGKNYDDNLEHCRRSIL